MKKKVLLSSILTIALCLSLIGGSTFALFTSQAEVGVVITAGEIDMTADIAITKLESVTPDQAGTIVDENGGTYSYKDVTSEGKFTNGGTATVANGVLTMEQVTPGDKITFTVSGANNGNIAVQYRYVIECSDGFQLMSGLVITVDGGQQEYTSLASYTSPWAYLDAGASISAVPVTIELPVTAGNEYQGETADIRIVVEAVQSNAVVTTPNPPVVESLAAVSTLEEFEAALADPTVPFIAVVEDMALTIGDVADKTFHAAGNDVSFTFTGAMDNVVVMGIEGATEGNKINVKNATGDLTVKDSKLTGGNGTSDCPILAGPAANLTVENCELIAPASGKSYGIYNSGSSGSLVIKDSTFEGFTSWAIQINSAIDGDLVVTGCTFNCPDGVLKALSGVNGNATFTGNVMIGCQGHDAEGNDALVVSTSAKWAPLSCTGVKTFKGNTLNGVKWQDQDN